MILHRLIRHHLRHRDDEAFYVMQAEDALRWMREQGVTFGPGTRVLDLGCGSGIFGAQLLPHGCEVTFSDCHESLRPEWRDHPFRRLTVGEEDLSVLGEFDVVLCSNVFEHLARPGEFLAQMHRVLRPRGVLFLSWTNWLSPWGGHDFSPFHYLGPRIGHRVYDLLRPGRRQHVPYAGLYPTHIGPTLRDIRRLPDVRIRAVAPRYYTEFAWIMRIPLLREFLAWNCALLIERRDGGQRVTSRPPG